MESGVCSFQKCSSNDIKQLNIMPESHLFLRLPSEPQLPFHLAAKKIPPQCHIHLQQKATFFVQLTFFRHFDPLCRRNK